VSTPAGPGSVLLSPDKFKHTLGAAEVAASLARGIHGVRPDVVVDVAPVADGGDGTVAAAIAAGYDEIPIRVAGPTGEPVHTRYARSGDRAIVELATICGMERLPFGQLHPLDAHTIGLGQGIAAAVDAGCREVVIGLGGSASTDGGTGVLVGLGATLLDIDGMEVRPGARNLARVVSVDLSGLHRGLAGTRLRIASDVRSPLLGPTGSVATFGPQKGLNTSMAVQVESDLAQFAGVVERQTGRHITATPGGGAAGGVGAVVNVLLGADLLDGAAFVLDILGLEARMRTAGVVVTGEGRCDRQTLEGKAPAAVADLARRYGVPVWLVAGDITLTTAELAGIGVSRSWSLVAEAEGDVDVAMKRPADLLEAVGRRIADAL
jgi:glycerate kinase